MGESPLKCQSRPFAMPMAGSVTLKLVVLVERGFRGCFAVPSPFREIPLPASGLEDEISWDFSRVSTCSTRLG